MHTAWVGCLTCFKVHGCADAAATSALHRYGVGMQLDFVAPSAGAIIVFWNVIVVRHLCINNTDEPLAIALMPRIPGAGMA